MSSTKRNKVKSFGDPSIAHGEMADRFLIVGAFNAPPVTNRVKKLEQLLHWIKKRPGGFAFYVLDKNGHSKIV